MANAGGGGDLEGTQIQVGEWYMATVVVDENTLHFYLNGTEYESKPTDYGHSVSGEEQAIVGATRNIDRFFEGAIDDIRIYGKALTQEEIDFLYNKNSCIIAKYSFNNNYSDSSFNNFNATGTNLKFTKGRYGKPSRAADFDGSGYAELPSEFDMPTRSINVWFKADDEINGHIYNSDADDIVNGRTVLSTDNITTSQFSLKYEVGDKEYYEPMDTGSWHMATITVNPNDSRFYLDGQLLQEREFSDANSSDGIDKAVIGTSRLIDQYFKGSIDELTVYNCELDSTEIKEMYSAFVGVEDITAYRSDIKFSPNPTNGPLSIQLPKDISQCRLTLVDMAGRELGSFYLQGGATGHFDLSGRNKGMYILRLEYDNHSSYRKIILK